MLSKTPKGTVLGRGPNDVMRTPKLPMICQGVSYYKMMENMRGEKKISLHNV
jgi:hypothetical protein